MGFTAKHKVLTAEINKEARCRHSYEWYQVLKKATAEYPGPPYDGSFAATRVTTHYAASSPDDPGIGALEAAADEAWLTLDRTMKWESTPCRGSCAQYEFRNVPSEMHAASGNLCTRRHGHTDRHTRENTSLGPKAQ